MSFREIHGLRIQRFGISNLKMKSQVGAKRGFLDRMGRITGGVEANSSSPTCLLTPRGRPIKQFCEIDATREKSANREKYGAEGGVGYGTVDAVEYVAGYGIGYVSISISAIFASVQVS